MASLFNELHFEEIDSTSSYLKREYANLTTFTIVSASYQTNGKGRLDRSWISEKNTNLLFSLLLKEDNLINAFPYLSLASAYVVAEELIKLGLDDVKVKWPNDVYVKGKKICGILLEGSLPTYLVVGIGLNVNQNKFNDDLRHPGTSIKLELGKSVSLNLLSAELYQNLVIEFKKIFQGDLSFLKVVKELDYLKGKEVLAEINNKQQKIKVTEINDDCSLKVVCDGKIMNLSSGEISFH